MIHSSEGIKSKGNIIVGFDTETEFDDESTSHAADLTEVYARVYKLPDKLYYNREDQHGMQWDCDQELQKNDLIFFNTIESFNAVEVVCDGKFYRIIPYSDIYCAKRQPNPMLTYGFPYSWEWKDQVIMLNGYVLLEPIFVCNDSPLALKTQTEDKTKGIVRYVGKCNREYQNPNYIDFQDLEIGDMVLLNPGSPVFPLERKSYLATFDGDNLYNVVQRRRIAMVLSRNN